MTSDDAIDCLSHQVRLMTDEHALMTSDDALDCLTHQVRLMTDEHADFGLRFLLRAKAQPLLAEALCDALLELCCKQHPRTAAAARAFDEALEGLAASAGAPSDETDELAEHLLAVHISPTSRPHQPVLANRSLLKVLPLDSAL